MSPQLAGMTGPVGESGIFPHAPQAQVSTNEAVARGAEGFMLHEEPTDLQMQMHLAMQAQMNLHRQMLTRKVEVAQHLARHSSVGNIVTSSVPSSSSRGNPQVAQWASSQQLQQQQPQQYQQQQRQQQQQEQEHFQQHMNLLSRPSLSAATSSTQTTSASTDVIAAGVPTASEAMVVPASTGEGQPSGPAATESNATGMATDSKSEDDGMDLYRWDRIDLNVELDDDDLFGFLKS